MVLFISGYGRVDQSTSSRDLGRVNILVPGLLSSHEVIYKHDAYKEQMCEQFWCKILYATGLGPAVHSVSSGIKSPVNSIFTSANI